MTMRYYLCEHVVLKRLESPCLYHILRDELYELDDAGFEWLSECATLNGGDPEKADADFIDYCVSEGLLSLERINVRRPVGAVSPRPSLRYLELQITDKCNLKCKHCYVGSPRDREIAIKDLLTILDEFEKMQGLRLIITGGEPILHSEFDLFNEALGDCAFRKILFTNGTLIDREILRGLNVDEIQFSIDGMENGHDFLRGIGSFRKSMASLKLALDAGLQVSVSTMIHKKNLEEFEDMKALFDSMNIKDWIVDAPTPLGRLEKYADSICVTPEIAGRYFRYGFGGAMHGGGDGYGCGPHLAAALANGAIAKCAFYSDKPAGYISEGLANAWARIKPVELASLECSKSGCSVLEECRGGCRFRASVINGEFYGGDGSDKFGTSRDFYKCFYYGIM